MSKSKVLNFGLYLFAAACSNLSAETFAQTVLEPQVDEISERTIELVESTEVIVPTSAFEPKWVWSSSTTDNQSVVLIQRFNLSSIPQFARLDITVDNEFNININGHEVPNTKNAKDWNTIDSIDVKDLLIVGDNLLEINATNQDGPAGAIALIQMRTDGALSAVGTGQQSQVVTGDLLTPATVVVDAFGAPWNLPKPADESAKSVQARREAKRLMEEIGSPYAELSARAMVLLAHLAIEQPNTSFDEPIFNLSPEKPLLSILENAKARIRDELHFAQEPLNHTSKVKFNGSLSAAKILIANGKTDAVQDFFAAEFAQPCANVEAFQIALISTMVEWISSDVVVIQEARKKVNAKSDEAKNKAAELNAKRGEIESSNAKITQIEASKENAKARKLELQLQERAIRHEIELLDMVVPTNAAIQSEIISLKSDVALIIAEKNLLTNVVEKSLSKEGESEAVRRYATMVAEIELAEQLTKLESQLAEQETSLVRLVRESIERLTAVEAFLLNNRPHLASGFVRALTANSLDTIRSSRLTFHEINAFNVASSGFARPSGRIETISAFGARTSATDLPGVSARSVGDRPGVSVTAPFDPAGTGTTREFLPASDYRGERELRGAKNNPDSAVEKAPGAAGAVFIRS